MDPPATCAVSHHVDHVVRDDPRFTAVRDLLAGVRLDGPPDPTEHLTASGVRVPNAGTELPARAHYENAIAADYAKRGYTHFAELIEAGHACSACHLTHFINRPPTNAELDLGRYAKTSAMTKTVRDTVEVLSFASMSVGARIARTLDGPFIDGSGPLSSPSSLEGIERASPELLEGVRLHGRDVLIAQPGSDEMRYLEWMSAEAAVGGPELGHILLKPNPSKAAVLEEFLHGTQQRLGMIKGLGISRQIAEVQVKDFMIRHARLLTLTEEDVAVLRILKEREIDILRAMQGR